MSAQTAVRERQPRHLAPMVLPSLGELAVTANREHGLVVQSGQTMLGHAIAAGAALHDAKAQVPKREWRRWLADHFAGTPRAANLYMRCSTYEAELPPATDSLTGAIEHLRGLPATATAAGLHKRPDLVVDAKRLAGEGRGVSEISDELGVPHATVWAWLNPEARAAHQMASRERGRKAREALATQEREREIKRAVRKAGAALAEAYSMANRYGAVIAQAEAEATTDESRAALQRAGAYHRKMSDEIVRALGVSA